jgi:hypothetical protein
VVCARFARRKYLPLRASDAEKETVEERVDRLEWTPARNRLLLAYLLSFMVAELRRDAAQLKMDFLWFRACRTHFPTQPSFRHPWKRLSRIQLVTTVER